MDRKDIVSPAHYCTLLVSPPRGQRELPAEWHLLWTADQDVSFIEEPGSADVGAGCSLIRPANEYGRLAHADTLIHCAASSAFGVRSSARYVLSIPIGTNALFRVVNSEDTTQGRQATRQTDNEASIGGGAGLQLPPVLRTARLLRNGGLVAFEAQGWNLDAVTSAAFRSSSGGRPLPLEISHRNRGSLVAAGFASGLIAHGYLLLSAPDGCVAAAPIAAEPDTTRLAYARDRLIVRTAPGELILPTRSGSTPLRSCCQRTYRSRPLRTLKSGPPPRAGWGVARVVRGPHVAGTGWGSGARAAAMARSRSR
jgi:hypothetical protein